MRYNVYRELFFVDCLFINYALILLLVNKTKGMNDLLTKGSDKINLTRLNSAVIIPALNPVPELEYYVKELLSYGIAHIIVVNDGSESSYNSIFEKIKQHEKCTVLLHAVNRGKGRALKTALKYFMEHFSHLDGAVTADADGQHSVKDICNICEKLSQNQNSLILGVRNFKMKNVPFRSYFGNTLTSGIFKLLYGYYLSDTQTGLRGLPSKHIPWITELNGERYDYEINMLIQARRHNLNLTSVPIETLYYNNNSGSHYSTIKDSVRILKCLLRGLRQPVDVFSKEDTKKNADKEF